MSEGQPPTAQPTPDGSTGAPAAPQGSGLVLGLGITGLVIGILALLLSFVPCFGAWAIYPGAIAVILSGVATYIGFSNKVNSGLAVAALVVSLLSVAGGVYRQQQNKKIGEEFKKAGEQFGKELNKGMKELQKQQNQNK